jgi:flap endonuclease-1
MGIKHLNSFLRENCPQSIRCMSIRDLSGKKIAIDISIYLYKYIADNCLIENMYLMISIFRYYNIVPIFIFDGKPPAEKKELLKQRKENKIDAEKEYNRLKEILEHANEESEKQDIVANMDALKKQFVYVSKKQIDLVKELIMSFGITYYDAPGEADEVCAALVIKKKVWGCMSEDMDLFAYGCPRVLRYFSLLNRTTVVYCMKSILKELNITQKEFRQICILSGTDYNSQQDKKEEYNLQKTIKLFKKYKKSKRCDDFYDWISLTEMNFVENLHAIYKMFDLSENNDHLKNFDDLRIANSPIIKEKLFPILEEDGFVFNCGISY